MTTTIYTDGACKGNGKQSNSAGGFGVFIRYNDGRTRQIWGGEPDTTNNRMELMAAIVALQATTDEPSVQIWTDSNYVKQGITEWIVGWRQRQFKNVKNPDLWQQLDALCQHRVIDWQWVKGHAGHAGNEMADKLANLGVHGFGDKVFDPNGNELTTLTTQPLTTQPTATHTPTSTAINNTIHHTTPMTTPTPNTQPSNNPSFTPSLPSPINTGKGNRQLILDTETTGLDPKSERIIEIGIIELIDRKATGEKLHVYLNPQKLMNHDVISIHGISNDFVADKPVFADVAQTVYDFIKDSELIAHNAEFDLKFLKAEFDKVGLNEFVKHIKVLDTLKIAKQLYPDQRNNLDALVKRLNVGKKDRTFHGALLDAEILTDVYLAMTSGQSALLDSDNNLDVILANSMLDIASWYTPPTVPSTTNTNSTAKPAIAYDGDTSRANPHFVPILPDPINAGKPDRQLIFDTETTGFEDQDGDRIVEVGVIELVGRKFTGEKLHVYINPEKHMDDDVIRVHGISNEFVADKPKFAEVAQKIYDFMKGAEIIAHNASFDMRFLAMEFGKVGLNDFEQQVQVIDSLALAKQLYPGQKNSLDALVKRLNVGKKDRTFHGALLDSEILADVYLAMTGGQVALAIDDDTSSDNELGVHHEDLSYLSHLLIHTKNDRTADETWRNDVLK